MRTAFGFIESVETQNLVRQSLNTMFDFIVATKPVEIPSLLAGQAFDLFLLDVSAWGESAIELAQNLRQDPRYVSTPLIFLSNVRDTRLLVAAFEAGGDDLIYVPFLKEELLVRVDARFRRLRDQPFIHDLFWRADLRFSLGTQRVVSTDAGGEIDLELTPNEFKILYLLARNESKTLSRQNILQEVWGENLHVVERTVDKHICSLRRKMGSRAHYVASIPGLGYCFSTTGMTMPSQSMYVERAMKQSKISL